MGLSVFGRCETMNTLSEPITVKLVADTLQAAFPNANIEIRPFTGGTIVRTQVWKFDIDLSLTTKPISYGEKEGAVRMVMNFRPDGATPMRIKHGITTELGPIKAFTLLCRGYLEGIATAILMACDNPPPPSEADLV